MKAYMTVQQVVEPRHIVAQAASHDLWLQHLNDLDRWPTYAFLGSEDSVTSFLIEIYGMDEPADEIMEVDLEDGLPYVLSTGESADPTPQGASKSQPGRIRVLRLLEYTYDDPEWMAEDMLRWTSGLKMKDYEMRSATLQPSWDDQHQPASPGEEVRATYEGHRVAIQRALALGLDVEANDPEMADAIPELTERQAEWIAGWLVSEGIGKLPRR